MSKNFEDAAAMKPFVDMVLALSDKLQAVSFLDANGVSLWSQARAGREPAAFTEISWSQAIKEAADTGTFTRKLNDTCHVAVGPIANMSKQGCAFLCLQIADAGPVSSASLLQSLSELMVQYFEMNCELNAMADELTRRYEELNLIYETDEEISHVSETRSALGGVVENCAEYMSVDLSVLLVPGSGNEFAERLHEQRRDDSDDAVLSEIQEALLSWVTTHGETVVMNSDSERQQLGLDSSIRHKIVASPIQDQNARVLGVLAVINSPDKPDFENGDRSLLAVMGRRASKIMSAEYDSLTGLMNRETFSKALGRVMRQVLKKQKDASLLHVNIDRMQLVNDALGHDVGDALIVEMGERIRGHLRGSDHLARIGGDEFGIVLDSCGKNDALRLANRLIASVTDINCSARGQRLDVGISIGVVSVDENFENEIELLAAADMACSAAKEDGRGRTHVYRHEDKEMQDRTTHMRWVGRIQQALKDDRFILFSQEIAPVDPAKHPPHYEILLRMIDEEENFVSPGLFMPVAERYHMMADVDCWVIGRALLAIEQFEQQQPNSPITFAINLSGLSLTDHKTLDFVVDQLRKRDVNASNICFEITETAAISNLQSAKKFIARVKNFGCKFALDDFGAGVSSFSNLRALDLDYVKIDGSFVSEMTTDPVCEAMVNSINQVGQTMNLETVAEFVETPETEARLRAIGVNFLQGYGIAKPRPLQGQLEELLATKVRSA